MLLVVNVTAADNKHRKLIIALCNEELFRFIARN